ncbi:MAG: cob(I)yrinic acid a,c-diamide adenosyltransferase [Microbacteriaceae bacterium]|nr:cob(I)yrinic acid a,c-diamide adenosyltransferase [Cryobacterium sp.]MBX3104445.1 cob(I)yrinic acid a,c-diamide adenosyltransferase [Cryobacterium sp.]MCC6375615.1 cob(I)yrinic acid a,c-diamide adenosyltransferase [Microbacteriaceae bacterium]
MARVYTRKGDDGTTSLLFGGRTSKGGELVDALGDLDEAVSALGLARSICAEPRICELLLRIQKELFVVSADLATNPKHRDRLKPGISIVTADAATQIEKEIDALVAEKPLEPVFLVPGTTQLEAAIDLARTVVRRGERHVIQARNAGSLVTEHVQKYLNRVSDLLFVMGRHAVGDLPEPPSHD